MNWEWCMRGLARKKFLSLQTSYDFHCFKFRWLFSIFDESFKDLRYGIIHEARAKKNTKRTSDSTPRDVAFPIFLKEKWRIVRLQKCLTKVSIQMCDIRRRCLTKYDTYELSKLDVDEEVRHQGHREGQSSNLQNWGICSYISARKCSRQMISYCCVSFCMIALEYKMEKKTVSLSPIFSLCQISFRRCVIWIICDIENVFLNAN